MISGVHQHRLGLRQPQGYFQGAVHVIRRGIPGSEVKGDIYGDVVREVMPDGTEVWTWRAHEHLDHDPEVIHPQDGRHHWPMANAVSELSDGSLALSFRKTSTVVLNDRTSGNVTWRLGHDMLAQ